jgi:hypothetical protein
MISPRGVVILTGWRPLKLPPGRYWILGALPPFDDFLDRGRSRGEEELVFEESHPIFALPEARLYSSRARGALHMQYPSDARVLLRSRAGKPLAATINRKGLRLVVFGFEDTESDLSRERNYRLFVTRVVEFLAGRLRVPEKFQAE